MLNKLLSIGALCLAAGIGGQAHAVTSPYTETFEDGASGWTTGTNPGSIVVSGGVGGGAYLSTTANTAASGFGSVQVLFRCENAACSDAAFQGDWRADVGVLSWYFRHDATVALQAYARIAAPSNNPGASAVVSTLVQPNTWTRIDLAINASNPEFISFSGQSFDAVFDDVGRVQLGISIPTGYSANGLHFDVDQVSLLAPVPEPETYALMGLGFGVITWVARRRTRRA